MQWMILNHQGYLVTLYYWIIHYSCHLLLSLPSRTYRSTTYIVHIILFIPSWLFSHLLHPLGITYLIIILFGLEVSHIYTYSISISLLIIFTLSLTLLIFHWLSYDYYLIIITSSIIYRYYLYIGIGLTISSLYTSWYWACLYISGHTCSWWIIHFLLVMFFGY